MKKIFTLCLLAFVVIRSNSQVVLNEVYTDPGSGKHEFFELYNTSTNPTPENLDNYLLISYYVESGKTGFYVLDFPNQTISSKSYYTGASASPFNVQGQSNLTASFSWNAMPSGGQLKKWEKSGSSYTSVSVPANLNDLFVKRTGSGASYHIFIFKNGVLINGLIGGSSSAIIPSYIKSMPAFTVAMVGYNIAFSSILDNQAEYVTPVPGTDNGYIRKKDGTCGGWDKSSSQAQHTPNSTNGSSSGGSGALSISSYITEKENDNTKSVHKFNITDGPAEAFPVVAETYRDLGIIGQFDANDILVDSRTINDKSAGEQVVELPSKNESVLLVAKCPAGCYDVVLRVENLLSTLPVHLTRFQGNMNNNNKVTLTWTAADNENVDHFEVEKSVNGKEFTTAAMVFATEKIGNEDYQYFETINSNDKVMFRLKMFDKGQDINYSKILVFQPKSEQSSGIKIFGNPVKDKLTFSYASTNTQITDLKVYDFSGRVVLSQKMNSREGSNMVSLPLAETCKPGMYVVEITNGTDRQIAKFVKQ